MRIGTPRLVKLPQFDALIADRHRYALSAAADMREPFEGRTGTMLPRYDCAAESTFVESSQATCLVGNQTNSRESPNPWHVSLAYGHVTPRRFRNMAYRVCEPPMNSRSLCAPPNFRFDTR